MVDKLNPKIKEKLHRAIKARLDARVAYVISLNDPDCIEAVELIEKVGLPSRIIGKTQKSFTYLLKGNE